MSTNVYATAFSLRAPDFDRARETHPTFGEPLMVLYMVLGAVILVNMLVAFFNQSYSDVVAKAREEHLLHFSIKVRTVTRPRCWAVMIRINANGKSKGPLIL